MDISSGFITLLTVYSISIPTQTKLTNAETYTLNIIYEPQRAKTCLTLFCRKSGKRQKRSKTLDCGKNIPRSRFYCLVTVVNRCVCKLNYSLCCERGRKRELILSFRSGLRRLRWVWITGKAWCIV